MPSLNTIRAEAEGRLDRILAKLDRRHRAMVIGAVRAFGSVELVPQSIWDEIQQDIENETAAALLALIILSDDWTRAQIGRQGVLIGGPSPRDVAGYGTVAAIRAQTLAADRLAGIQRRMAETLRELGDIKKAASEAFGAVAREREVVTTTTDTISLGQRAAGRAGDVASTADGEAVEIDMIWRVHPEDSKTGPCPICAPLDNTPERVWGRVFHNGPPGHPNCVCSLSPHVVATGEPARTPPRQFGRIRPAYTIGV